MQSQPVRRPPQSDHIGLLPNDHSHAEKKKLSDLNVFCGGNAGQNCSDLLHSVSPLDRSHGIMPGNSAAVNRCSKITERKVDRMPLQIVNKKCMARHAQTFLGETNNLSRLRVMEEQRTAHRVKTIIAEGKRQRVSADRCVCVAQMRGSAIQNDRL